MKFTFVILYYNRHEHLLNIVKDIVAIRRTDIEVIIVDNNSEFNIERNLLNIFKNINYIRLEDNFGAVARNRGISLANGEFIVCLDDDVVGIKDSDINCLEEIFCNELIAAVCFKIIDPVNGEITNWLHHYDKNKFANKTFLTNEISEGAVCFRKSALIKVGLYYEKYFISHEGPDLACRLLDANYDIIFCPDIIVAHYHSNIGRKTWRRYYYDTRNILWLSARNYPLLYALNKILYGIIPMFVYSLRDGFVKYWFKGIVDGLNVLPEVIKGRCVISQNTLIKIKNIEKNRPNLFVLIKSRFFQKRVRI